MSNSNNRNKDAETIHHLTSRIAHRVYFLKECERNDFLEVMRRTADFTGIKLLGWCVMSNHFHLLIHLPQRVEVGEEEVLRRYGVLKGRAAAEELAKSFLVWRKDEVTGESRVTAWLESQRRRMYDVGNFMKIVKQWFTEELMKQFLIFRGCRRRYVVFIRPQNLMALCRHLLPQFTLFNLPPTDGI